jgi:hypothetical protein
LNTPTTVHGMTTEEKFTSKKLYVSHLKMFGCITYVHVPNEKRSKLKSKAEKCIFIGPWNKKDINVSNLPLKNCK